ncbi:hypothetical protein NDU88_001394 [Pleurodeles waltl]|uniref:Uncharacterized protein n=1 Tax=Pleurodeles waltl TaxID=8319 RepID=A0AAV7VBP2_PLEWA|nr:hypothetical protein NDU88_001394 [Pleurodeles waltl]
MRATVMRNFLNEATHQKTHKAQREGKPESEEPRAQEDEAQREERLLLYIPSSKTYQVARERSRSPFGRSPTKQTFAPL